MVMSHRKWHCLHQQQTGSGGGDEGVGPLLQRTPHLWHRKSHPPHWKCLLHTRKALPTLTTPCSPCSSPLQPGPVAIVTGVTDGIGRSTARQLAWLGVRVVVGR